MKTIRFAICLLCIGLLAGCKGGQRPSTDTGGGTDAGGAATGQAGSGASTVGPKVSDGAGTDTGGGAEAGGAATGPADSGASDADDPTDTDQGWTDAEQVWFYGTSQGAQLIQYRWMLALEQAASAKLFLEDDHIDELRFISRGFDPNQPDQAEHLPVGLVRDESTNWFGFTCAACHTTELDYKGSTIRIDGGGTMGDTGRFLTELTEAVQATLADPTKFDRFANRVLGSAHTPEAGTSLQDRLDEYRQVREDYDRRNAAPIVAGHARLDAFGRIFNKALEEVDGGPDNFNPPDAPVSYPFLWGTDQSDYVQWVGDAPNADVGSLVRNVGEVLGVFAYVHLAHRQWYTIGYPSSVQMDNLIQLEDVLRKLNAPAWPKVLPQIDQSLAGPGGVLFNEKCAQCHNLVDRTDINRKVVAWMERLDSIKTDPKTAENIVNRKGQTGVLEGRKEFFLLGTEFGPEAPVVDIVTNEVAGILIRHFGDAFHDELISLMEGRGGTAPPKQGNFDKDQPSLAYKGRSLDGVWATAPYLHNGSVPSLWQLLTKPEDRVKTFHVGSRDFDPKEVGLDYKSAVGTPFDTTLPGNSNAGHEFGTDLTDDQKWQLIEFMKTDMAPLP